MPWKSIIPTKPSSVAVRAALAQSVFEIDVGSLSAIIESGGALFSSLKTGYNIANLGRGVSNYLFKLTSSYEGVDGMAITHTDRLSG